MGEPPSTVAVGKSALWCRAVERIRETSASGFTARISTSAMVRLGVLALSLMDEGDLRMLAGRAAGAEHTGEWPEGIRVRVE